MKLFLAFIYTIATLLTPSIAYPQQRIIAADLVEGITTEKNYLGSKSHFEKNSLGVSAYADAAAAYIVDATGGSPNTTCARTTSSPLAGQGSLLMTVNSGASRQGEGCSVNFSIDGSHKGGMVKIAFDYALGGTFVDGDVRVQILDVTNNRYIEPAPTQLVNHSITTGAGFSTEFQASIDSTSYRLAFHVASVSTAGYTVKLDDIKVGKVNAPRGQPVTDWVSFTPTGSWSTNTTYTGKWRRVGDVMEAEVLVSLAGAPTASGLTVNLPSGFTIDTSKQVSTSGEYVRGAATVVDASPATNYTGLTVYQASTTAVGLRMSDAAGTYSIGSNGVTQAQPITFASGDSVFLSYKAPIVGWSSSAIMSSDASTRVTAASAQGTGTNSMTTGTTYYLAMTTSNFDTHGAQTLSAATNGTTTKSGWYYTCPTVGYYQVSSQISTNGSNIAANTYVAVSLRKNGSNLAAMGIMPGGNNPQYSSINGTQIAYCRAGDYLELAFETSSSAITLANNQGSSVSVMKVSGPEQIAASESVSALYTGAPPTGTLSAAFNTVTFGTKVKDSHNAYSAGVYTVPVSGVYSIVVATVQTSTSSTAGSIGVSAVAKNGSTVYQGRQVYYNTAASQFVYPIMAVHGVPLLAGDTITPQTWTDNSGTKSFSADAALNYFSIVKTGNY